MAHAKSVEKVYPGLVGKGHAWLQQNLGVEFVQIGRFVGWSIDVSVGQSIRGRRIEGGNEVLKRTTFDSNAVSNAVREAMTIASILNDCSGCNVYARSASIRFESLGCRRLGVKNNFPDS